MRKLSLSLVALALISLAPASDAQQAAQVRKANIQAKNQKSMALNAPKAKNFMRFNAWENRTPAKAVMPQGANRSSAGQKSKSQNFVRYQNWKKNVAFKKARANILAKQVSNKSKHMKATKVKNHAAPTKNLLKQQFGKRTKIKQAVKAQLASGKAAKLKGKASMAQKQR